MFLFLILLTDLKNPYFSILIFCLCQFIADCKFSGFYYEIEVAKGTNNLIIIQLKRTTYGTIKLPPLLILPVFRPFSITRKAGGILRKEIRWMNLPSHENMISRLLANRLMIFTKKRILT